jgi:membrane associated rhomboid family serine protease
LGWLAIIADVTGIMSAANDGIGHLAHLGGFLAIACIVFFLDKKEKEQLKKGLLINVVSALIVVSLWFFFIRTGELAIPSL